MGVPSSSTLRLIPASFADEGDPDSGSVKVLRGGDRIDSGVCERLRLADSVRRRVAKVVLVDSASAWHVA